MASGVDVSNVGVRARFDRTCQEAKSKHIRTSLKALSEFCDLQDGAMREVRSAGLVNSALYCLERGILGPTQKALESLSEAQLFRTHLPPATDIEHYVRLLYYLAKDARTVKAIVRSFPRLVECLQQKVFRTGSEEDPERFYFLHVNTLKTLINLTMHSRKVCDQIVGGQQIVHFLVHIAEEYERENSDNARIIVGLLGNCVREELKTDVTILGQIVPFIVRLVRKSLDTEQLIASCTFLLGLAGRSDALKKQVASTRGLCLFALEIAFGSQEPMLMNYAYQLASLCDPNLTPERASLLTLESCNPLRITELRMVPRKDSFLNLYQDSTLGKDVPAEFVSKLESWKPPAKRCSSGACSSVERDGEKFKICSKCRVASYCSADCQKRHWKQESKAMCIVRR